MSVTKINDAYKIFFTMMVLILLIQLGTLLYIWHYESTILLEKERANLHYQLEDKAKHLTEHLNLLEKELEFLAILEVMDDVLVNDIDKRIGTFLEKRAEDFGEGIVLLAKKEGHIVASSHQHYQEENMLHFSKPLFASFNQKKVLGSLLLLYPYENFMQLKTDNLYKKLWLTPPSHSIKFKAPILKESIVVSRPLSDRLEGWSISLAHEKEDALMNIYQIERILLWGFLFSLSLLILVVWTLSKKQIKILSDTQEILELKRTFLSTMSHELRTPLGLILNLTQHLMNSPHLTQSSALMLTKIESAAEHLLSMINNLLQLSKLESHTMSVKQTTLNVTLVVEEMIEMVEPLIEEKALTLEISLLPKDEAFIISDSHLLKQVIINLLSNAIKFTEQGSIRIELRRVGEFFYFKVIDTGIGIALEKQEALFSPFYQAHMGKSDIKHSTGLGLALSQKVAHLLSGNIIIQSEGRDKGCEVSFIFKSL